MNKLSELDKQGQAIWLDTIRRSFITSGELERLIVQGIKGVTSNPSIFEKAIAGSADYDRAIEQMARERQSTQTIYETLVLEDIRQAADLLRPVYEQTDGRDGYVSLEVNPALATHTDGTIAEAQRLFAALDRANVMIKVPATPAGIPAIEALIAEGINVNVTLIFSLTHYEEVAEAYLAGLERRAARGGDLSQVASVASIFVSRLDVAAEGEIAALPDKERRQLEPSLGKLAIANAQLIYAHFCDLVGEDRWKKLAEQGARVQRPLWASTGVKNPLYPDTTYVDNLVGPDTVNTVPLATLNAFLDHGSAGPALERSAEKANVLIDRLDAVGIDLDVLSNQLQETGVLAFHRSFERLLDNIAEKRQELQDGWQLMSATLGSYASAVELAVETIHQERIMDRIWKHDHTVWKSDPTEITNRLGWLNAPEMMTGQIARMEVLGRQVREEGYENLLLLGMGGSSLAPEVFGKVFANETARESRLQLMVLDSTDPGTVLAYQDHLDPASTLLVVATKSGGTVETLSFFKSFYNWMVDSVGVARAGEHFIAITDPGSKLAELANDYNFRDTFLNDPHIGGRYSALSFFGLVPAVLAGIDAERLLDQAQMMACNGEQCNCAVDGNNHSARLGAILGELALAGRDKATFILSPALSSFGDWVEQLIAESTGKEGKGIVPVVGEEVGEPESYGNDRLFVYLRLEDDDTHDEAVQRLEHAGEVVVRLRLKDRYDLGGQFFLWEMATVVAGYRLNINPFDQPNVEAAKVLARKMVSEYRERGALPESKPVLEDGGMALFDDTEPCCTMDDALALFLYEAGPDAYLSLQAYLQPDEKTDAALAELRTRLRNRTRLATTVGYGPRFLHSTGQLHKGDAGNGLFIQLIADMPRDEEIPDEAGARTSTITFGVLKTAQALGDYQALQDEGRRVIRFHLGSDVLAGLKRLADGIA